MDEYSPSSLTFASSDVEAEVGADVSVSEDLLLSSPEEVVVALVVDSVVVVTEVMEDAVVRDVSGAIKRKHPVSISNMAAGMRSPAANLLRKGLCCIDCKILIFLTSCEEESPRNHSESCKRHQRIRSIRHL